MIVKPLLVERVVAVLALNPWNYGKTLALMVGQMCLGQGLEGAARVVAVQSSLRVNGCCSWWCFFSSLWLFLLFSASILRCSTLCWMVVHQGSRSWAYPLQVPDKLHFLRSLATMPFDCRFCPPAEHFPPAGAHMRSCLGSRSSGILERCMRKRRRCCKRMDDILCCFTIMHMLVWCFFSLTETPRMIWKQQITKNSRWRTWGSNRTVLSSPYIYTYIHVYIFVYVLCFMHVHLHASNIFLHLYIFIGYTRSE